MSLRPLEAFGTALIAGFLAGVLIRSFFVPELFMLAAAALLSAAFLVLGLIRKSSGLLLVFVFLIASFAGLLRFSFEEDAMAQTLLRQFEGNAHVVTGIVSAAPDARENATYLTLDVASVDSATTSGRVFVSSDAAGDVRYGDLVRVIGTLKVPEAFETDGARIFDYPHYLAKNGVTHTVSYAKVQVLDHGKGNAALAELISIKDAFSQGIGHALVAPESALAAGLVLGEKQGLGKDLTDMFRAAGIVHIIVLSGYNIALVAKGASWFFGLFRLPKRPRLLLAVLAIVAFVLATGASASSVRAAVMAALVILADVLGRSAHAMRLLIIVGAGMVLWNPYVLAFDPGFQLSFLATAGLIAFTPHVSKVLGWVTEKGGLREIAASTIATQAAVLPALLSFSGQLSIVSLPMNLLVLPVIAPAMMLSGIAGTFGILLPKIAAYVGLLPFFPLWYVVELAKFAASMPFASIVVPPLPVWLMMLCYACIGALIFYALKTKTPADAGAG